MSERAGLNKRFSYHFVLDESKLRKIVDVMRTSAAKQSAELKLTFHASTEDKSFFSTGEIDKLLGYENPKGKEINTLHIELRSTSTDESTKTLAQLVFSTDREEKIQLSITGPDRDWCFVLGEELETQAKRTHTYKSRPWLQSGLGDLLLGALLAILAVVAFVVYLSKPTQSAESDIAKVLTLSLDDRVNWLIKQQASKLDKANNSIAFLVIPFFLVLVQSKPVAALSHAIQRSTFYWGDAKTRHDNYLELMKNIKWVVLIGTVVSILSGLAIMVFQVKFFS